MGVRLLSGLGLVALFSAGVAMLCWAWRRLRTDEYPLTDEKLDELFEERVVATQLEVGYQLAEVGASRKQAERGGEVERGDPVPCMDKPAQPAENAPSFVGETGLEIVRERRCRYGWGQIANMPISWLGDEHVW